VEKIPVIRKTAIQKDGRYIFNNPALSIVIFKSGPWVKETKRTYLVPCTIHILLTVTSAKSEEDRRRIANPLVFAIILALVQQDLGLNLKDPGIEPKSFDDVTSEEEYKENKIVFLIEFSVGFYFTVPKDDEDAADLIGVATDYLLEQGDFLAAQDETTLQGDAP
jgi:hypothetical protein